MIRVTFKDGTTTNVNKISLEWKNLNKNIIKVEKAS